MRDFNTTDNDYSDQDLDDSFGNSNLVASQEDIDKNFGSSNYDNKPQFKKQRYFKLVNGSNIYRIMPPMFDNREKAIWAEYYSEHFGFVDAAGKQRKFLCTRRYNKDRKLEVCLFCEDQRQKEEDLKTLDQEIGYVSVQLKKTSEKDPQFLVLEEQLSSLELQRRALKAQIRSRNTAFWVNAMNQNGEFGVLPLKKKLYEQLAGVRDKVKNYRDTGLLYSIKENEGIDPLNANEGVWFDFHRTGSTFQDTQYTASVVNEVVIENGKKMKVIKQAPLSNEQKALALKECQNLSTMYDYLRLTLEEQKIVINGSPEAISAVINSPRRSKNYHANSATAIPVANKSVTATHTNKDLDQSFGNAAHHQSQPNYVPSNQQIMDELS